MSTNEWRLYFDGACCDSKRGRRASYGWCLYDPQGERVATGSAIHTRGERATNNVAEWAGLLAGVSYFVRHYPDERVLRLFGDSQLVIYQLTGRYKCHADHLRSYRDRTRRLLQTLDWQAKWIRREFNEEADQLAAF